jgi:hypothetical protein
MNGQNLKFDKQTQHMGGIRPIKKKYIRMKWDNKKYLYLTLMFAIVVFYSCEKVALEPVKIGNVTFSQDIKPIFSNNCIACHGGAQSPDLRPSAAYNSLKNGGYLNLTSPKDSRIIVQLYSSSHTARATEVEKQKILQWITLGAKND